MSILNFFRRKEKRSLDVDFSIMDGASPLPYASRPHAAESLAAVFGCVQAISSAISALPVRIYENAGKARHEVLNSKMTGLIHRGPNPYQTMPEFLEFLTAQILLWGNALVEIIGNKRGEVEQLRIVPWNSVNVQMLKNGRLAYDVYPTTDIWTSTQGKIRRLLQGEVIHIRDRSDDGIVGRSRLQRAAAVIRSAKIVHDFATSSFENGMFPSGVVTTDGKLAVEVRERLQSSLSKGFSGPRKAARTLVLDNGLRFQQMSAISPEDAELLESRKWTVEEICRIFMVPPPIVQSYQFNTFTNSEQAGRWFAQFCLLPLVRKIECAFNAALWPDGQYELDLDMTGFDRGDPAIRWQNHSIAISNGILSVDEVREEEGYGPRVKVQDGIR